MNNSNQLKLNETSEPNELSLMAIIKDKKNNSLKIRKFVFLESKSTTLVPKRKFVYYKPPRLVVGKGRKYVEYYYRVPLDLPGSLQANHNPPGKWERFRVFEGINKAKDTEFDETLLATVEENLRSGWSPFKHEMDEHARIMAEQQEAAKVKEQVISLNYATEKFLEQYKNTESKGQYRTVVKYLKEYLTSETELPTDQWYQSVKFLTEEDLLEELVQT